MKFPIKCPECGEPAKPANIPRRGAMLAVEPKRLKASHLDGEPLCTIVTPTGYQPAMPIRS